MATERQRDHSEVGLCGKYFIFIFNFVILIVSLGALGIGIYARVALKEHTDVCKAPVIAILVDWSWWLVIFGAPGTILSLLACIGSLREIIICLKIYVFLLYFAFLVEVVAVVFVCLFVFYPDTLKQIGCYPSEESLNECIVEYRKHQNIEDSVDDLQQSRGCCGFSDKEDGYTDWNNNEYFNCTDSNPSFEKCSVPWSCCKFTDGEYKNLLCGRNALRTLSGQFAPNIYKEGCIYMLRTYIQMNVLTLGGIILALLVSQFFLVKLARDMIHGIYSQMAKW